MTTRIAGLLLALTVSCATPRSGRPGPDEPNPAPSAAASNSAEDAGTSVSNPPGSPLTIVTDPKVLVALEAAGFSLGEVLDGQRAKSARELSQKEGYGSLIQVLEKDIAATGYRDALSGVGLAYAHRLFNVRWLRAASARYELVGVVNRMDRRAFEPAHCGETRFVYRLAYTTKVKDIEVDSRLPMTVNVVAWQPGPMSGEAVPCVATLKRWVVPESGSEHLSAWLASDAGPLPRSRPFVDLKSVEIDLQSMRWPATVHPSMAGHAEYVLRVFHRDDKTFVPATLENQINVPRLRSKPALSRELLAWLKAPEQRAAIDAGTVAVPEKFLAKAALSVTPRGLERLGNRPFRQLFSAKDFGDWDGGKRSYTRSAEELIRRLDELSCTGCHQSRSVAGFHLLGLERRSDKKVDALAIAASPHLVDELGLRQKAYEALLAGKSLDRPRPLAERDPASPGVWGSHCALAKEDFADWKCASGLVCTPALGGSLVGVCQESEPAIGAACETGTVTQKSDPHRDRVHDVKKTACREGVCEDNSVGFPGGMCSAGCNPKDKNAVCGGIAILVDFNDCIARHKPFESCITQNTRPANLRACDENRPCRDDYVCAETPNGGGCIPPYFLFQLRVDGHPSP